MRNSLRTDFRVALHLLTPLVLAAACREAPAPPAGRVAAARQGAAAPAAAAPAAPRSLRASEKVYRGAYRRTSSASEFLECGAQQPLEVRGRPDVLARLRDRYRWSAVSMTRPLFAVFRGAIVEDTLRGAASAASDSMPARGVMRRFQLVWPESLRAWRHGDCGLSQPPHW